MLKTKNYDYFFFPERKSDLNRAVTVLTLHFMKIKKFCFQRILYFVLLNLYLYCKISAILKLSFLTRFSVGKCYRKK